MQFCELSFSIRQPTFDSIMHHHLNLWIFFHNFHKKKRRKRGNCYANIGRNFSWVANSQLTERRKKERLRELESYIYIGFLSEEGHRMYTIEFQKKFFFVCFVKKLLEKKLLFFFSNVYFYFLNPHIILLWVMCVNEVMNDEREYCSVFVFQPENFSSTRIRWHWRSLKNGRRKPSFFNSAKWDSLDWRSLLRIIRWSRQRSLLIFHFWETLETSKNSLFQWHDLPKDSRLRWRWHCPVLQHWELETPSLSRGEMGATHQESQFRSRNSSSL